MKILFASDFAFKYFEQYNGKAAVDVCMSETKKLFENADFSIVNLENVFGNKNKLTPIIKSGPNLISDVEFAEYIYTLNPSAIGMANNHCFDYGEDALMFTINTLKEKGYQCIGAGKDFDNAYKPAVFELDGIGVDVIAACENEFGMADNNTAGAAGYNLSKITNMIKESRKNKHIPIIYFHGGNEYNPFPSPGKTELYRHFVDIGAAAVIAMHTHCPQGYEIYNGCPIIYSMGNFFFPAPSGRPLSWQYGYMASLNISENSIIPEFIPYKFNFDKHTLLKDDEKKEFMKYIDYISKPIANDEILKKYFDSWCMMYGLNHYANGVKFTETMVENGAEEVKHLKNIFSCEAHNELISNTLKIIYEGRVEAAKEKISEIKMLQNMEIPI